MKFVRQSLLFLLLGILALQRSAAYDLKAAARGGDDDGPAGDEDESVLASEAFVADCFVTVEQGFPYPVRMFFADEHTYALQLNVRRMGASWIEHIIKPLIGDDPAVPVPTVEEVMTDGLNGSPFRGYAAGYDHNYAYEGVSLMGDGPGIPPLVRTFANHGTPLDMVRANFPIWGAYGDNVTQLYNKKASDWAREHLNPQFFRDYTFGMVSLQRLLYPKHLLANIIRSALRIKSGRGEEAKRGYTIDEDNLNVNSTQYVTRVYWWRVDNDNVKRYKNLPFVYMDGSQQDDQQKTHTLLRETPVGYVKVALRHAPGEAHDGELDQIAFFTAESKEEGRAIAKLLVLHGSMHQLKAQDMSGEPNPDFEDETF
eukprot:GDKI01032377.1.p1 GENE.GDKI01032377.1~~GDKI01032377.1.p1  ORF type:complete len:370 (-),score=87.02 GDKI01032377.1:82-1191(-)